MITQLPGFENLTRDSQQTFRALLNALSSPGKISEINVDLQVPEGLTPACGAACLTLIDLETAVWLQPVFSFDVQDWLRFHTGCAFVASPKRAAFAVVYDADSLDLEQFYGGSAQTPESSTTLLVQVNSLRGSRSVKLTGPGILHENDISPALPESFWTAWQNNYAAYPQGVDVFLFEDSSVMGLPRTVSARIEDQQAGE